MSATKKPRTTKKKAGETSNPAVSRIDLWFPNPTDKTNYLQSFATKLVFPPKYIDLEWFASEGFLFPALLEAQGLKKLVEMKGTFYPDLVKVFYTCAKIGPEGIIRTQVKGVRMEITSDVWETVAGIFPIGERRFIEGPDGYNKMETYRGMLQDPHMRLRMRLSTGPMKCEDRMLHYIITYILTPRSTNHAQATDDDLQLVHGIKNSLQLNWILIFEEIMLKAKRLIGHQFPYAVLISRFIDFFQVDVSGEVVDNTTPIISQIKEKHLIKLEMVRTPEGWQMAAQQPPQEGDEEEEAQAEEEGAAEQPSYSPFESLLIQKMDAILTLQHEHRAETSASLEAINTRLEHIEQRLALHGIAQMEEKED